MSTKSNDGENSQTPLAEIRDEQWGEDRDDHFGYASDEERRAKRGMEDWEMVEHLPRSQKGVPLWFLAVIVAVLLVAIGLSFPFWGDRPGYERAWFDWGFVIAIAYLLVFGTFVYFMVNHYSPSVDGIEEEDNDSNSDSVQNGASLKAEINDSKDDATDTKDTTAKSNDTFGEKS